MSEFEILSRTFFGLEGDVICNHLMGSFLCMSQGDASTRYLHIHEIELYDGFLDKASHAYKGKTPRNAVMFELGGCFYVYLCYGVHWMLNIVCGPKDYPSAILIRGAGEYTGPGKLSRGLGITRAFDGKEACPENGLWFAKNSRLTKKQVFFKTARIGVNYAGPKWSKIHRRYVLNSNPVPDLFST